MKVGIEESEEAEDDDHDYDKPGPSNDPRYKTR